ncbi:MAG: endolytic transglycosylase MltG [Candidatus Sabulitectum sp.]|nr:endolytic transglycosylase MltG [Candidatus Sabulitectum sp.]
MKKILVKGLIVLLAAGLAGLILVRKMESPPGQGITTEFALQQGWGVRDAAQALEQSGLVRSRWMVLLHYRLNFQGSSLQAGNYILSDTMQVDSILAKFISGDVIPVATSWVTLPPGLRMEESLPIISESLGIPLSSLEDLSREIEYLEAMGIPCFEGYLFPETYEFADSMPPWNVIDTMVRTGFEVMDAEWDEKCEALGLSSFDAVILASIVEREAASDAERDLVAGVFLNRLRISMRLESCATVQYALGEVKEILLYSDLEIESPFNTYRNAGLPPSPICSPGTASLEAVANPDTTGGYLFFVSKGDGSGEHLFAVTAAGHASNIRSVR